MSLSKNSESGRLLEPEFHERVWGSFELEPWFPKPERKTGEVWFREDDSPVLTKFLFADENLSVQVHPNDELARAEGHGCGKTEMWHILRAGPEAKIALGFEAAVTSELVRRAAADGSIMGLLRWIQASVGDTWFIPAGAVHAIGAGIALCEIQQHSDVTYRLFDYGRGRELHVEESIRALNLEFQPESIDPKSEVLVDCPYFKTSRISVSGELETGHVDLAIVLEGAGNVNGTDFKQGDVWKGEGSEALHLTGNARLLTAATKT